MFLYALKKTAIKCATLQTFGTIKQLSYGRGGKCLSRYSVNIFQIQ